MSLRFSKFIKSVAFAIAVVLSAHSHAQSIFSNAITGNNPSNQNPYATNQIIVSGITSTGIGRGAGVNNSNSTNTYNATNWSTNGTLNTGNNDYFQWVITPTNCSEIDFSNLILFYQRTTSGPQNIALRSSVNNYATNIWTSTIGVTTEQNATIDLSAFQNINTPITFRLYGWNAATTNGNFSINSFDFQGVIGSAPASEAGVITGNQSVCSGTSTLLTATGGVGNVQWQSSANNITFTNIAGATALTYNTPVLYNNTYYRAVFTNGSCPSANSSSLLVNVILPSLTAVGATSCVPSALTIGVTQTCTSALSTTNWYANSTGGTSLATGNSFTTPVLNTTTTYYANSNFTAGAALSTVNRSATLQRGLIFDAYVPFVLNSVQINTNGAGSITLELRNNLNQPVAGAAAIVFNAAAGTNTVPLDWTIPAGTGYRIIKTAGTIQFSRTDPFTFPSGGNGVLSITSSVSNGVADNTRYFYFYNWNVSTLRIPVVATIGGGSGGSSEVVSACDLYTWASNGQTYSTSGIYTFQSACSNDTLDLTITPGTINTTYETTCDVYTWSLNGQQYTTSGTYTIQGVCSTEILELTIVPNITNTTVATACDMYVWDVDGQQYTASGTYTFVNGCATEVLELTITPSSSNITTVSACDTYTWSVNGQQYTSSGTYLFEVGCVLEMLELTISPATTNTTTVSTCDAYTWAVNGATYSTSGTYTSVVDCNTEILELTIVPNITNTTVASACDMYVWAIDGQQYTASGTYTFVNGCVTEILELTITPSSSNITTVSACDTYTWAVNGQQYTSSGTYLFEVGCLVEILELTITPSTNNTTTVDVCDTYTWSVNGATYTTSGTFTSVTGCHTETLVLTITLSTNNTTTASACDSYTWSVNGATYTTSGTYTSVTGCHTETLVLTITLSTNNTTTASACDSYTWTVNGTTYTTSGTYTSVTGCNTETLVLTITPSTNNTTTASACDSYTWTVNGTTYTTSGTYTSVTGCHTETLVLTITPSTNNTTTASACDSYTWTVNGTTYTTSGTYTSVTGCNTETLILTITPSTSNTTTASACDSYTWSVNGTTYTTSGTYTSVTGCNTETLVLTITPSTNNTTTASACDSYTWSVNGTTYTTSGTYTSVTGCHTETLVLTITPSTNNTTTVNACATYTWSVNGITYTTSGTYTFVSGCLTETLNLTIEVTSLYFVDADLDGFGSTVTQLACASSVGYSTNSNDCNDANGSVYPSATEVCNNIDDNCNGQTDEGVQTVFFIDNDGDNYGNASAAVLGCTAPAGYTADNNDCNDTNAAINPGAQEILGNNIDDNCDGQIDVNIDELSSIVGLYPNPVRSDLNIQIDAALIGNEMYIFDVVGNLVYKQQLLSTQTAISVSNLVNGNYIVRIGQLVKRFEVIK